MLQAIVLLDDPAEPAGQSKMFVTEEGKKGSFSQNENNQASRCNILFQPPLTRIAHYSPDKWWDEIEARKFWNYLIGFFFFEVTG